MDQPEYWSPHPSSQPVLLPSIPSSSSSSSKTRVKFPSSTIQQWLTGPTLDDIVEVDPETRLAYEKRWEFKWDNFTKVLKDEVDRSTAAMGGDEVRKRGKWLASDFERLNDRFIHLDIIQSQPELTIGRIFCLSLIEDIKPDLHAISSEKLPVAKEFLKKVELVNQFVTQSVTQIIEKHNLSRLKAKLQTENSGTPQFIPTPDEGPTQNQNQPNASNSSVARSTEQMNNTYYPLSPIQQNTPSPSVTFAFPTPASMPMPDHRNHTVGIPFRLPFPEVNDGIPLPVLTPQPQLQPNPIGLRSYSAVSSHKTTLAALLTLGFFGASITWSTIFSGTRGNLILISWSACVFIVATSCAASASLLAVSEESIVEKHPPVRWVVRILSRLSSLHVFAGLILLSVAVLVLDPSEGDVVVGAEAGNGRLQMKVAGGYALVMSSVPMVVVVAVRRRYTHRRWFN